MGGENLSESELSIIDIAQISTLIGDRLGLCLGEKELNRLPQQVTDQMARFDLENYDAYYRALVEAETIQSPQWQALIVILTNKESRFFRDEGQFKLLRTQILPDLIQRRSPERRLTLWSAGCATGEEAYSLAILLKSLIPNIEQWHIQVWGTDINTEALQVATKGHYGDWSFRSYVPLMHYRYFTPVDHEYVVKPSVQRLIHFAPLNLLAADAPLPEGLQGVDLILCRNVFIHFDREAIAKTLELFSQVIRPDGYLLTGHAELHKQNLLHFQPQLCRESRIYRPQIAAQSHDRPAIKPLPSLQPKRATDVKLRLSDPIFSTTEPHYNAIHPQQQINTLIRHHRDTQAIALIEHQLQQSPQNFQLHYTLACLHANLKQYSPAVHHCRGALALGQTNLHPYYLMAYIAEARNRLGEAKLILRQILHFDAKAALAYYDLARIYYTEGDRDFARGLDCQAHKLLQGLDPDLVLDPYRQLTVQRLRLEMDRHLMLTS